MNKHIEIENYYWIQPKRYFKTLYTILLEKNIFYLCGSIVVGCLNICTLGFFRYIGAILVHRKLFPQIKFKIKLWRWN